VSSPSGVRRGPPAGNGFWRIWMPQNAPFCTCMTKYRGTVCTSVPHSKFWGTYPPVIYAHASYEGGGVAGGARVSTQHRVAHHLLHWLVDVSQHSRGCRGRVSLIILLKGGIVRNNWPTGDHTLPAITRSPVTAEIARVGGHYAVQGHSRSPILVPIKSPYMTYISDKYSPFPRYCRLLVKLVLSTDTGVPLFNTPVRGEPLNSGSPNLASRN